MKRFFFRTFVIYLFAAIPFAIWGTARVDTETFTIHRYLSPPSAFWLTLLIYYSILAAVWCVWILRPTESQR